MGNPRFAVRARNDTRRGEKNSDEWGEWGISMSNKPGAVKFWAKVRWCLEQGGTAQKSIAKQIGVTESTISKWMSDSLECAKAPDVIQARVIADFIGVSLDWLTDDESPVDRPLLKEQQGPSLSDDERFILQAARTLGMQDAMARLLMMTGPPSPSIPAKPE
jgi:transcriptional regulator with XRE-family HTH domain